MSAVNKEKYTSIKKDTEEVEVVAKTCSQLRAWKYAVMRCRVTASLAIRSVHLRPKRETECNASLYLNRLARRWAYKRGVGGGVEVRGNCDAAGV